MITGVAGGIGRATAEVLAEAGWCVVGVDRQKADALAGVARFIHADISLPADLDRIFGELTSFAGRLDAVVNNAALQIVKPLLQTTADEWDRMMAANVRSVFLSVQRAYPLLKASRGAVINVSSVHALATSVGLAAYAASKGALLALTRVLALELGPDGIRVNAILPGAVDTPMLHAGLSRGHLSASTIQERIAMLGSRHALGRIGQPLEIARAILFLADKEQSSFLTGQSLVVDGGATARLSTE